MFLEVKIKGGAPGEKTGLLAMELNLGVGRLPPPSNLTRGCLLMLRILLSKNQVSVDEKQCLVPTQL